MYSNKGKPKYNCPLGKTTPNAKRLLLRLPPALKYLVEQRATEANTSLNAFMIEHLRKTL